MLVDKANLSPVTRYYQGQTPYV